METPPTKLPPPKLWFTAPHGLIYKLYTVEIEVVPVKKTEYEKCVEVYPQHPELCQLLLRDSS